MGYNRKIELLDTGFPPVEVTPLIFINLLGRYNASPNFLWQLIVQPSAYGKMSLIILKQGQFTQLSTFIFHFWWGHLSQKIYWK